MHTTTASLAIAIVLLAGCGGPRTTTQQVRFPDGALRWEYEAVGGVPDGASRTFHPNGVLASEGRYVRGVRHGMFKFYDPLGTLIGQTLFENDVEVWQANTPDAYPPLELEMRVEGPPSDPRVETLLSGDPTPRPYFTSTDRTTSLTRAGMQLGFGGDGDRVNLGESRRAEIFGNYRLSDHFGAYTQLAGSTLVLESGESENGRQTLELGGTYHRALANGTISPRLGVLVPVGADTPQGWLPAATSAYQRPTDAAAAATSTLALRSGASWTRSLRRLTMQADLGIDWLAGDPDNRFDALGRANTALGYGTRRVMMSLELTNTMRLSAPSDRIHALGLGGSFWVQRFWLSLLVSRATSSQTSFTAAFGYGL